MSSRGQHRMALGSAADKESVATGNSTVTRDDL